MVTTLPHYLDSRYRTQATEAYDGVVRVAIGGYYGTGILLYDGQAILTVAHLFEGLSETIANVYFDYCCHPKRGDDIVGFRKGNDVFVHHKLCERAAILIDENEPMTFVKWTKEAPDRYKLIVSLENKKGSLATFLAYLAKMQVNLVTIELGKAEDEGHADYFEMILELPDKNINSVRDNLKGRYRVIEFVSANDAYK